MRLLRKAEPTNMLAEPIDILLDREGNETEGVNVFDLLEAQGVDVSRIRQVEQERT
ncbi:hypothetical protein UFOVP1305_72 [uncultured Caudovirales phage]|uniref:Uncharacterized protein n=1 Tax=uncultured Caudovirales phage TaxID=2100421 RepID=A0A6J5PJR1_9CAUD|nr:hypothetical protein UFOVP896_17 [uncultured Caudovirales phage]CAB4198344.1 hypothetical protein UFOVP1305_72 [uncultured Caudovirales phage]